VVVSLLVFIPTSLFPPGTIDEEARHRDVLCCFYSFPPFFLGRLPPPPVPFLLWCC